MKDAALDLLTAELVRAQGPVLWLVDEHLTPASMPAPREDLICLSNRVDAAEALGRAGHNVQLSDFDLAALPQPSFASALYRVSKEKLLVHYLINEALARLPMGGRLYLSGFKGDGVRTYIDKAAALVDGSRDLLRGKGGAQLAIIEKRQSPSQRLDDGDYRQLRNIAAADQPALYSKPGIFGWQKIDRGSELLVRQLPVFFESLSHPAQSVMDLGCGYGYITVMAHALHAARYLATDNNMAAVAACRHNLQLHGIPGEVIAADCARGVTERVDAVLCNPPFHQGFDTRSDLTDRFLEAASALLNKGGHALFVVNQFIPVQRKAERYFSASQLLAEEGGFKVVCLRK